MRILITGGTGLLGRALVSSAENNHEIVCTYVGDYEILNTPQIIYKKLDMCDREGYFHLFRDFKPEVTIHTAGVNKPDYVESNNKEAWKTNVGGTQNVISACEEFNSKFIYISSNAIYNGDSAPYREEDNADPVNYYGKIKLACEEITKESDTIWAIVRPILMYGWNYAFERPNIVTAGISRLRKREKFFVYDDVYYTPLYHRCCAEAIWKMIENNKFEIFNIGGKDSASIYELLKEVVRVFELDGNLLIPVQQGFFKELVKRPKDTSYNTAKMENVLGLKPLEIKRGLELMRQEENELYA